MKLQVLIDLKPGDRFKEITDTETRYCIVLWTEFFIEELGVFDDEMKYSKNFGMCYRYGDGQIVTLRSCRPDTDKFEIKEYSL